MAWYPIEKKFKIVLPNRVAQYVTYEEICKQPLLKRLLKNFYNKETAYQVMEYMKQYGYLRDEGVTHAE